MLLKENVNGFLRFSYFHFDCKCVVVKSAHIAEEGELTLNNLAVLSSLSRENLGFVGQPAFFKPQVLAGVGRFATLIPQMIADSFTKHSSLSYTPPTRVYLLAMGGIIFRRLIWKLS